MEWVQIFESREKAEEAVAEGKIRRVVIEKERISLIRTEGRFYAIQDSCPHSGASMSEGWLNNYQEVVCPLHNYCYHLVTGREATQQTRDVKVYEVRVDEEGLFIRV